MPTVTVAGVPDWVDAARLLGDGPWVLGDDRWIGVLDRRAAADVEARLRGWGVGGQPLEVEVVPPLKRPLVRQARSEEAIRRRATSPGFLRSGTRVDREAQISLTPEALAMALAERVAGQRVVDATAGAGGNAIAFARHACSVIAIEPHPERRRMLIHNARIYGVHDRVDVVDGRSPEALGDPADVLFVDVPWGDFDAKRTTLDELPLLREIVEATRHWPRVWAKVPASFDVNTLPGVPEAWFGVAPGDRHRVKFLVIDVER